MASVTTSAIAMNVAGISATAALGEMFNQRASRELGSGGSSSNNTSCGHGTPSVASEEDGGSCSDDGYTASNNSTDPSSNDAHHVTPEYVPGCFEGPEKTMEVVFSPCQGAEGGLRLLTRDQLDYLCTLAKCTIMSKISSAHMDAYVLSESSLFVYRHRWIMKTCGTTTLLRCLSTLLQFADALGMELTWVGYSRKNLLFPSAQLWPHSNFGDEIKYITSHAKLQDRLRGNGHILGPITGDHWFVYVADHTEVPKPVALTRCQSLPTFACNTHAATESLKVATGSTDRTVNLMMFDMAPEVAKLFFKSTCETGKEMTARAGIDHLCPGATIDETAFSPCGYSMNAILHDAYFTIHITPEQECSYASFETNTSLPSYASMVRNVLNVFRPKRFVLTMFADEAAVDSMVELPTDPKKIAVPGFGVFARTSLASTKVETDLCCLMGCYALDPTADTKGALPVQAAGVKRHTHARSSSGSSAQWLCLD